MSTHATKREERMRSRCRLEDAGVPGPSAQCASLRWVCGVTTAETAGSSGNLVQCYLMKVLNFLKLKIIV